MDLCRNVIVWGAVAGTATAGSADYSLTLINEAIAFSLNPRSALNSNNEILKLPLFSNQLKVKPELRFQGRKGDLTLFAAGRYQAHLTSRDDSHMVFLDEGFINLNLGDQLALVIGRQKIDWGSGYAWNPFNVFNSPNRRQRDGFERQGIDLVKVHWSAGNFGLTGLLASNRFLREEDSVRARETRAGVKIDYLVGGYDLSVLISKSDRDDGLLAAYLTKVIGRSLELHSEAVIQNGNQIVLLAEETGSGSSPLARRFSLVPSSSAGTDTAAKFLIGGQYTFATNTNIVVEYFYNGLGFDQREWDRFALALGTSESLRRLHDAAFDSVAGDNPFLSFVDEARSFALKRLAELRRHYLFLRAVQNLNREKIEVEINNIINLQDGSLLVSSSFKYKLRNNLNLGFYLEYYRGSRTSEFGNFLYGSNFRPLVEWFF